MCTSIQSLTLLGVARLLLSCGRGALASPRLASPRRYMDFYFPAGAPAISSTGTAYWNESLGLLWTPNLEHSRLTRSDPCRPHVRSSSRVCALAETAVCLAGYACSRPGYAYCTRGRAGCGAPTTRSRTRSHWRACAALGDWDCCAPPERVETSRGGTRDSILAAEHGACAPCCVGDGARGHLHSRRPRAAGSRARATDGPVAFC